MKTPTTLKESRTEIRSIFREKAYELFEGTAIKNLTPEQTWEAITVTVKTDLTAFIPEGKTLNNALTNAFADEFKVIASTMPSEEFNELFDTLLDLNDSPDQEQETEEESEMAPVDISWLSDVAVDILGEKASNRNELLSFIETGGLKLNDEAFGILTDVIKGKLNLMKETPSNIKVTATASGEDTMATKDKRAAQTIEELKKLNEASSETYKFTEQIKSCKTEEALREVLSSINERRSFVFVSKKYDLTGLVTATRTNKKKLLPVLVVTLEDGTITRSFSHIFTTYFTLLEDAAAFEKLSKKPDVEQPSAAQPLEETTSLRNELSRFSFDEAEKSISGADLTDHNNDPRCYSTSKRGLKKSWLALVEAWTPETTMSAAINILSNTGTKMHSYCAMD